MGQSALKPESFDDDSSALIAPLWREAEVNAWSAEPHQRFWLGDLSSVRLKGLPNSWNELVLWTNHAKQLTAELLRQQQRQQTMQSSAAAACSNQMTTRTSAGWSSNIGNSFTLSAPTTQSGSLRFCPSFVLAPRHHELVHRLPDMTLHARIEFFSESVLVAMESISVDPQILLIPAIEFCRYYALLLRLYELSLQQERNIRPFGFAITQDYYQIQEESDRSLREHEEVPSLTGLTPLDWDEKSSESLTLAEEQAMDIEHLETQLTTFWDSKTGVYNQDTAATGAMGHIHRISLVH